MEDSPRPQPPRNLAHLPTEILLHILHYLPPAHHRSLFGTCHHLTTLTRPSLYTTLTIRRVPTLNNYLRLLLRYPHLSHLPRTLLIHSLEADHALVDRDAEINLHEDLARTFGFKTLRAAKIESIMREPEGRRRTTVLERFLKRGVVPEERMVVLLEVLTGLERVERFAVALQPSWMVRFFLETVAAKMLAAEPSRGRIQREGSSNGDEDEMGVDDTGDLHLLSPSLQRAWGPPDPRFALRLPHLRDYREHNCSGLTTRAHDLWGLMFLPSMRRITCTSVQGNALLSPDREHYTRFHRHSPITHLTFRECNLTGPALQLTLSFPRALTHLTYTSHWPGQWRMSARPADLGRCLRQLGGSLEVLYVNMDGVTAFGSLRGESLEQNAEEWRPNCVGSFEGFARLRRLRIPMFLLLGGYTDVVLRSYGHGQEGGGGQHGLGPPPEVLEMLPPSLERFEVGFESLTGQEQAYSLLLRYSEELLGRVCAARRRAEVGVDGAAVLRGRDEMRELGLPWLGEGVHLYLPQVGDEDGGGETQTMQPRHWQTHPGNAWRRLESALVNSYSGGNEARGDIVVTASRIPFEI